MPLPVTLILRVLLVVGLILVSDAIKAQTTRTTAPMTEAEARQFLVLYNDCNKKAIKPFLAKEFQFLEYTAETTQTRSQFLAGLKIIARDYTDRVMEVEEVRFPTSDQIEFRGKWQALYLQRRLFRMFFRITLTFDHKAKIKNWVDRFQPTPIEDTLEQPASTKNPCPAQ